MKLVVGLGNPGKQYAGTRHNIGFDVLDAILKRHSSRLNRQKFDAEYGEIQLQNEKVLLIAPQTYMNLSGQSVQKFVSFYQLAPTDVLVVCDDLNLPLGKLRIRPSGSAGGQKGLQNIIQLLGTDLVPRLRLGIDPPPNGRDAKDWVLGAFSKSDLLIVEEVLSKAVLAVETWTTEGTAVAMNRFNAAPTQELEKKTTKPKRPEQPQIDKTTHQATQIDKPPELGQVNKIESPKLSSWKTPPGTFPPEEL